MKSILYYEINHTSVITSRVFCRQTAILRREIMLVKIENEQKDTVRQML